MVNLLLVLCAFIAIGAAVVKFLNDAGLRDAQKLSVQKRFDDWWLKVSKADHRTFALALTTKFSGAADNFLALGFSRNVL